MAGLLLRCRRGFVLGPSLALHLPQEFLPWWLPVLAAAAVANLQPPASAPALAAAGRRAPAGPSCRRSSLLGLAGARALAALASYSTAIASAFIAASAAGAASMNCLGTAATSTIAVALASASAGHRSYCSDCPSIGRPCYSAGSSVAVACLPSSYLAADSLLGCGTAGSSYQASTAVRRRSSGAMAQPCHRSRDRRIGADPWSLLIALA